MVISCVVFPTVIPCICNFSSVLGTIPTACGGMWTVAAISPIQCRGLPTVPCLVTTKRPIQIPILYSTAKLWLPLFLLLKLCNYISGKQLVSIAHNTNSIPPPLLPHGFLPAHCKLDNLMAYWPHFLVAPSSLSYDCLAVHSGCNCHWTAFLFHACWSLLWCCYHPLITCWDSVLPSGTSLCTHCSSL